MSRPVPLSGSAYAIARRAYRRTYPADPSARATVYAMMRAEGMAPCRARAWARNATIGDACDYIIATPPPPVQRIRIEIADSDGGNPEISETTIAAFLDDNRDGWAGDASDLYRLAVGESFRCGGGAAPVCTITRIEDAP